MAHVRKISEGKYLIRVSKGTGKDRKFVNITFRGTLAKAREHAREKETLLDRGIAIESALTFEKYFEKWLKAITKKVSPRTLDGYKGYIERYALSSLKKHKLSDIKAHHIQAIYIDMKKSPTTVRNLHAALNACFSYAVKKEYLDRNPCKGTDLPQKDNKEIVVLTPAEAGKLMHVCETAKFGVIFFFALETGMRPEEYLALRWKDIEDGQASVNQAVSFNRSGGGYYFTKPKTKKSRRLVPLSPELQAILAQHRREQNELRLKSKTWFDLDLVFCNEIGRPLAYNNLTRRYFKPILDKCDFDKHITLYSLRHSCATLLLMSGTNPKIVAERLGHSSIVLTLDTYSHVLPHIQDEATQRLTAIFNAHKMHTRPASESPETDSKVVEMGEKRRKQK